LKPEEGSVGGVVILPEDVEPNPGWLAKLLLISALIGNSVLCPGAEGQPTLSLQNSARQIIIFFEHFFGTLSKNP
jgi:hypothetical protein